MAIFVGSDYARPVEYRAEELAIKAGTTVRNLRAYRDHGLLPPPERRGRTVAYNDAHLDRLLLIAKLIQRGYTLANIGELLAGHARGIDVADLLGVEEALLEPDPGAFGSELTGAQLMELFNETDGMRVDAALEVGLIETVDDAPEIADRRYRVVKPRAFRAGRELVEAGVPLDEAIAQSGMIGERVRPIAHDLVMLVAEQLVADASQMPNEESARQTAIVSVVERLRPLAGAVLAEEFSLALADEIRLHLTHLIDEILISDDAAVS